MNVNPEIAELRQLVQETVETVEMVEQNARDNAYLRGAFEQVDKRLDNLTQTVDQRFGDSTESVN